MLIDTEKTDDGFTEQWQMRVDKVGFTSADGVPTDTLDNEVTTLFTTWDLTEHQVHSDTHVEMRFVATDEDGMMFGHMALVHLLNWSLPDGASINWRHAIRRDSVVSNMSNFSQALQSALEQKVVRIILNQHPQSWPEFFAEMRPGNHDTGSIKPLPRLLFDIYALALPRGHGFGQRPPIGAWQSKDGISYGVITQQVETGDIGILVMRRRIDHTWAEIANETGLASQDVAMIKIEHLLRDASPKEPMPPNTAPRPALTDFGDRETSAVFRTLATPSHLVGAWTLNQLYLAMPAPDKREWAKAGD